MKNLALCVFAVSLISGVAQAEPDAVTKTTLKLVKQFNPKYAVSGIEFDGSAIECVAGVANDALARATASKRARDTCAIAQGDANIRQVIKNLGGKVLAETKSEVIATLIESDEFQSEGNVVCARAKPKL
jgi:hypothetical protein